MKYEKNLLKPSKLLHMHDRNYCISFHLPRLMCTEVHKTSLPVIEHCHRTSQHTSQHTADCLVLQYRKTTPGRLDLWYCICTIGLKKKEKKIGLLKLLLELYMLYKTEMNQLI